MKNKIKNFMAFCVAILVWGVIITIAISMVQCCNKMDKADADRRIKENTESFLHPTFVNVMPDGSKLYKITVQSGGGSDTIYFYDNAKGDRVISTNYGDKMRRNTPSVTIERN